jgi:hypothetical protein
MEPNCQPLVTTVLGRSSPTGELTPQRRVKRASKPKLLTRDQLDGRTGAARKFNQIVADITKISGGHLDTVQKYQVEAYAGCAINLDDLNTRKLLGQSISLAEYNTTVSNLVRLSQRIGIKRVVTQRGTT